MGSKFVLPVESNRLPDIAGIDSKFGEPTPHPVQIEVDSNWESGLEFVRIPTPSLDLRTGRIGAVLSLTSGFPAARAGALEAFRSTPLMFVLELWARHRRMADDRLERRREVTRALAQGRRAAG